MKPEKITIIGMGLTSGLFALLVMQIPSSYAEQQVVITNQATNRACENIESCFSPSGIIINVDQSLTWVNEDSSIHYLTSGNPDFGSNKIFQSQQMMPTETFEFTFSNPGNFDYFCKIHPWMKGIVMVV